MVRRAAVLMLLLPGGALAQSLVLSNPAFANRTACASTTATTTWTWSAPVVPATADVYRLAAYKGTSACSSTVPNSGDSATVAVDLTTPTQTDSASILIGEIQAATAVDCAGAVDQPVTLCVYLVPVAAGSVASLAAAGRFDFWLAVPPRPIIRSVTPANGALKVVVSHGTATTTETAVGAEVIFTVTCTPTGGGAASTATGNASQTITCGGLVNGTTYTVTAQGTSAGGNGNAGAVSDAYSDANATTPQPFVGFWDVYQQAGGVEQGGCGAGGGGALAPAAALLAALALRRRRS
jgi:uncharacterized protein (TIGR03382 family)